MKIVSFTQGSEEWHVWRKGGIGASDIGIIMGSNPYVTPLQLWERKCGYGEEEPINAAMQHGITNEPVARDWLNTDQELELSPLCVEDNEQSFMRASLDGYDEKKHCIAEIKCPVSEKRLISAQEHQNIPKHWFHQMQWQIMLTAPQRAIFAIWDYRHNKCITVEMFGEPEVHKEMREKATDFWRQVQSGRPPVAQDKDYIHLSESPELEEHLEEYKKILDGEKILVERKKNLKKVIVDFGDDGNFKAYGFTVTRHAPRAKYNIEQMKIDGIDIDAYIKKENSIGYYVIKPPKS